jgi:hypothetical protein
VEIGWMEELNALAMCDPKCQFAFLRREQPAVHFLAQRGGDLKTEQERSNNAQVPGSPINP